MTVDLTLALAKFEGDSGKAAQIITRDSERMSRAARSVEAAFQKQQDQFKRTSTEALAVQAAQAGLIDTAQKLATLSEQEGNARASKAAAEGYTAAAVAAQSYETNLAQLNAQERDGLLQINALYRQKRDAVVAARESGTINDDGLKAQLANLRAVRDEAIKSFRASRDQKAAEIELAAIAEQSAIKRTAAIQKRTDSENGLTATYRSQLLALRELRDAGEITPAQFKKAGTELVNAQPAVRAIREIEQAETDAAEKRKAATQSLLNKLNEVPEAYLRNKKALEDSLKAGDISPAQFQAARIKLDDTQNPAVLQAKAAAEAANKAAAQQQAAIVATAAVDKAEADKRAAAAQRITDAENGLTASYREQLRQLEALRDAGAISGPQFLRQKTSLVEQQPAFISQQKQIAEEKAAAAAVAEGVRLRANAFQALQARIEVLTTGYVKLGDAARQSTQNGAEIEAGNRFIQNLNAQIFAIGKTREEKLRLEAASLGRSQQAEPLITGLAKAELSDDIARQITKVRELREQYGLTAIQVFELRAAQQGTAPENAGAIAALKREQDAYDAVAAAAKRKAGEQSAADSLIAKVQAEIAAQEKLRDEYGKTETQILRDNAARLGLLGTLDAEIAKIEALREANVKSGAISVSAAKSSDADNFIRDLIREREEIGKTREELLTLRAARAGVDAGTARTEIAATTRAEFIADIDKQIAAEKRKAEAINQTTIAVLRQEAAQRGLQFDASAAGKIEELEKLAAANRTAATAAEQRKKAEAFIAEVNTRAAGINDNGTQKAISEQLALKAATLGVSKEVEEAIKKIGLLDGKTGQLGKSAFASKNQLLTLQYTISDVVASAASGISPLTILLQQGGQVFDVFGGAAAQANGGFFKNFFGTIGAVLTPARLAIGGVTAALGALGFAFFEGSKQSKAFADSLVLTGNFAGITEGQFNSLARGIAASGTVSVSTAREFTQALVSTGEVGPKVFGAAAEAAALYGNATGKTAQEVAQSFASMTRDVTAWATENNRSLNFLTFAQLQQIKTLQEQGRAGEAQALVYQTLANRLKELEPNLGTIEKALKSVGNAWKDFWDRAYDIGRTETIEDKIARVKREVESLNKLSSGRQNLPAFSSAPALREDASQEDGRAAVLRGRKLGELRALEAAQAFKEVAVAADAASASNTKAAQSAQGVVDGLLKAGNAASVYKTKLAELERSFVALAKVGAPVSDADQDAARKRLKDQFTDKGGRGDSKAETEAERLRKARLAAALKALEDNLTAQRAAQAFHQQELQAIYAAGSKSLEDYYAERNASIAVGVARELETLASQRKALEQYRDLPTTSGSDRVKTQAEIDESFAKSVAIQLKAGNDITLSNFEQAAAFKQLGQQVSDYRANLLQLTGDERAAAELRAQQQIKAARQLEEQSQSRRDVQTPGDVRRFEAEPKVDVAGLREALAIRNDLAESQRRLGVASADAARAEAAFMLRAKQDGFSLQDQEKGVFAIRAQLLDQLAATAVATDALADRELAAAAVAGRVADPKILADAADAALAYAKALEDVNPYITRLRGAGEELGASLAGIFGDAVLKATSFKDLLKSIKDSAAQILVKEFYTKPLEAALQGQIRTFIDGSSGFAQFLQFGTRGNPANDIGSTAGARGFSAAKDTGLVVDAASSVTGASTDAAAATAATTAATGLSAVGTAATGAAPFLTALGSEATTSAIGVNAIGSESVQSALFVSGLGEAATKALGSITLFSSALDAAAAKAAGSSTVSVVGAVAGASAAPSALGNAFTPTSVMAFAEGDRFARDGIFPFAKGGSFSHDAEPRHVHRFAAGGTFTNRVVSQPTYFRFKDGGKSRLGLMGEAGPEAIMPLKRGRSGQGVQSYNRDGSPGPLLSLVRGSNGSLGVRAFAKGGAFERSVQGVRAFATGGSFYADTPSVAQAPVRAQTGGDSGGRRSLLDRVVIENHGAEIQRREETGPDGQQQLRLIVRQAVEQSRNAVAADIASGTGPSAVALKARGVSLGGNIPRRT